jgi:hypothetical protein
VVYGGDDVEFELSVRAGLEDARVDLDLLNARPEEFFEGRYDAGFLAGAGWAVY